MVCSNSLLPLLRADGHSYHEICKEACIFKLPCFMMWISVLAGVAYLLTKALLFKCLYFRFLF